MNTERVEELLAQAKSVLIMLENDLQVQQQDNIATDVVKVVRNILNEVEYEVKEK